MCVIRIRAWQPSDTPRLIALVNAAFAVETFIDGTRTDELRFEDMRQRGAFLMADHGDGDMAGCVYLEERDGCGYFGMLAVDPGRQAKGTGRALVGAAEDWCRARRLPVVEITVLSLRPELLPFYAHLGYREIRREAFVPSQALKAGVACESIVLSKAL